MNPIRNLADLIAVSSAEALAQLAAHLRIRTDYDLFTILLVDPDTGWLRRAFSSRGDAYSAGGIKKAGSPAWERQVLRLGQVLFTSGTTEMAEVFPDHQVLHDMGLEYAMNIPLQQAGRTVCTLNLLRSGPEYSMRDGFEVLRAFNSWQAQQALDKQGSPKPPPVRRPRSVAMQA